MVSLLPHSALLLATTNGPHGAKRHRQRLERHHGSATAIRARPSLALFMTFYVMGPTFDRSWQHGLRPLMQNQIDEEEAFQRIVDPFREFMIEQVREKDLKMFMRLSGDKPR